MKRHLLVPVVAASLLCACGASTTSGEPTFAPGATQPPSRPANALQALLASARVTREQSFRVDVSLAEELHVSGPAAGRLSGADGVTFHMTGHIDAASLRRESAKLTFDYADKTRDILVTIYDNAAYVSVDGGRTYHALRLSAAVDETYGPGSALQYLSAIGKVTDQGPGMADGIAVEQYHADFSPAKMKSVMQRALSSLSNSSLQRILRAMELSSGGIDASLDAQGRMVEEALTFTASIDLGQLSPTARGTTLSVSGNLNAHFFDYGATITVTPPGHAGSSTSA